MTIGVFDSGYGGLSVLREIRALLPCHDIIYVADQARVPYGERTLEEVRRFAFEIAGFLRAAGADPIVIACNTASAAALHELRAAHPATAYVGMEPAVKPAAEKSPTGAVGVLATSATFAGPTYRSVVARFGAGVRIETAACPELVEIIETGDPDDADALEILEERLAPLLEAGVDSLVLGCTHFAFLTPVIQRLAGPGIRIVDPAPAVARQVARTASPDQESGAVRYYTTGDPDRFAARAASLLGEPVAATRLELPVARA